MLAPRALRRAGTARHVAPVGAASWVAVVLLAASPVALRPARLREAADPPSAPVVDATDPPAPPCDDEAEAEREVPFVSFHRLPALRVLNINSNEIDDVRLYDGRGRVSARGAERLDRLLADVRRPGEAHVARLDRRALQLLYKAAYHFRARQAVVVSAYRKPGRAGEGLHASGRAIDFRLEGVPPAVLAEYLATVPKVGVGLYTHPRTQYVHLDVRDKSYYWVDASPPGAPSAEWPLARAGARERDDGWDRAADWPEGTTAPTR